MLIGGGLPLMLGNFYSLVEFSEIVCRSLDFYFAYLDDVILFFTVISIIF